MWDKIKDWVRKWLGIRNEDDRQSVDGDVRRYENVKAESVTATIANKLAMLTFADSTMTVRNSRDTGADTALGARTQLISDILMGIWNQPLPWIVAQMLGKGGKVLVPTYTHGKVTVNTIDHNRLVIDGMDGDRISSATLLSDIAEYNDKKYFLLAHYSLEQGGILIRYKVKCEDGGDAELTSIAKWADITPEITIANVDRMLFAYMKCPRDNRTDDKRYGVPITYGAETAVHDLVEQMNIYRKEYKLTRPMLGLDSSLWRDPNAKLGEQQPANNIRSMRKTVQDEDDPFIPFDSNSVDGKSMWQYYAPAIRYEAMEGRLQSLKREVEKQCGLSQGVLTERQTMNYANRDEVRAAQYDTFSVIKAIRSQWETAMNDLAYAIDVLAERFGVTPAGSRGQYAIIFDWDTSLIESAEQTFNQYSELQSMGAMRKAELRAWVTGESVDEAQEAIEGVEKFDGKGENDIARLMQGAEDDSE